jgi:hypothetical protein
VAQEVTPHEATKGTREPSNVAKARAPKEPTGDGAQRTAEPLSTHSPSKVNP